MDLRGARGGWPRMCLVFSSGTFADPEDPLMAILYAMYPIGLFGAMATMAFASNRIRCPCCQSKLRTSWKHWKHCPFCGVDFEVDTDCCGQDTECGRSSR